MRDAMPLIVIGGLIWYYWSPSERYAAEVGYYHGGEVKWDLWGDYKSLDECRDEAMDRFNIYADQKRGYSWSCLLKNADGGYESRHR